MPAAGIDTVTVPGAVAGWNALHGRFGRIPWKDLFQPAIFYAQQGYPVPELIHDFWEESKDDLKQDSESRRVFLPGGKPPAIGEIFAIRIWPKLCGRSPNMDLRFFTRARLPALF